MNCSIVIFRLFSWEITVSGWIGRLSWNKDDASGITSEATTIAVTSTDGFEDSGFLLLGDELIQYTGKTSTSFTGLTRGVGGTSKVAHANTDAITMSLFINQLVQELDIDIPDWRNNSVMLLDNAAWHKSDEIMGVLRGLRIPLMFSA